MVAMSDAAPTVEGLTGSRDLGEGHSFMWLANGPGFEPHGIIEYHPRADDKPGGCGGIVYLEGVRARHRLVSKDPITIEPSLVCRTCGCHGWIEDGKWTKA